MAFTIKLGYTNKKINSTAQGFEDEPIEVSVLLKEPTSILFPVFLLNRNIPELDTIKDIAKLNYIYCSDFMRFYWIDDISYSTNSIIAIACHVDVLATYFKAIEATPVFVKYCGDIEKANFLLDDERLQPELDTQKQISYIEPKYGKEDILEDIFSEAGTVFVTFVGAISRTHTGIIYSAMTIYSFLRFFGDMNSFWGKWEADREMDLEDIITWITSTGNYRDYIISAVWSPINYNCVPSSGNWGTTQNIYIGTESHSLPFTMKYTLNAYPILNLNQTLTLNYKVDDMEDDDIEYKDVLFLKDPKYTSISLIHPCGMMELNDGSLSDTTQVRVSFVYDLVKQSYAITIWSYDDSNQEGEEETESRIICMTEGKLGVDMMHITQGDFPTLMGDTIRGAGKAAEIGVGAFAAGAGLAMASGGTIAGSTGATAASYGGDVRNSSLIGKTLGEALPIAAKDDAAAAKAGLKRMATTTAVTTGVKKVFAKADSKPSVTVPTISTSTGLAMLKSYIKTAVDTDWWKNALCLVTFSRVPSVIANKQYNEYGKIFGYPCGIVDTLYNITHAAGKEVYIECVGANIDCSAVPRQDIPRPTPDEIAAINAALNDGIYFNTNVAPEE